MSDIIAFYFQALGRISVADQLMYNCRLQGSHTHIYTRCIDNCVVDKQLFMCGIIDELVSSRLFREKFGKLRDELAPGFLLTVVQSSFELYEKSVGFTGERAGVPVTIEERMSLATPRQSNKSVVVDGLRGGDCVLFNKGSDEQVEARRLNDSWQPTDLNSDPSLAWINHRGTCSLPHSLHLAPVYSNYSLSVIMAECADGDAVSAVSHASETKQFMHDVMKQMYEKGIELGWLEFEMLNGVSDLDCTAATKGSRKREAEDHEIDSGHVQKEKRVDGQLMMGLG